MITKTKKMREDFTHQIIPDATLRTLSIRRKTDVLRTDHGGALNVPIRYTHSTTWKSLNTTANKSSGITSMTEIINIHH